MGGADDRPSWYEQGQGYPKEAQCKGEAEGSELCGRVSDSLPVSICPLRIFIVPSRL